jgi:hypothetical protein
MQQIQSRQLTASEYTLSRKTHPGKLCPNEKYHGAICDCNYEVAVCDGCMPQKATKTARTTYEDIIDKNMHVNFQYKLSCSIAPSSLAKAKRHAWYFIAGSTSLHEWITTKRTLYVHPQYAQIECSNPETHWTSYAKKQTWEYNIWGANEQYNMPLITPIAGVSHTRWYNDVPAKMCPKIHMWGACVLASQGTEWRI